MGYSPSLSEGMDVKPDNELKKSLALLYSGQTTNFRTSGEGFAPVFIIQG
ncbi:MAG: hypothetical protein K2P81_08395 [Bacteriovoracaceae bacterium]|nr:hypothetical protein [Bacteriovoracaceae bacterium]